MIGISAPAGSNGIDDERIAFPFADRVASPRRLDYLGGCGLVHVNRTHEVHIAEFHGDFFVCLNNVVDVAIVHPSEQDVRGIAFDRGIVKG